MRYDLKGKAAHSVEVFRVDWIADGGQLARRHRRRMYQVFRDLEVRQEHVCEKCLEAFSTDAWQRGCDYLAGISSCCPTLKAFGFFNLLLFTLKICIAPLVFP